MQDHQSGSSELARKVDRSLSVCCACKPEDSVSNVLPATELARPLPVAKLAGCVGRDTH